jgi:hypothetical protein
MSNRCFKVTVTLLFATALRMFSQDLPYPAPFIKLPEAICSSDAQLWRAYHPNHGLALTANASTSLFTRKGPRKFFSVKVADDFF